MANVNLLPGYGIVVETAQEQNLLPGYGILNETVSTSAPVFRETVIFFN